MKTYSVQYVLLLILSMIVTLLFGQHHDMDETFNKQIVVEDILAYKDGSEKLMTFQFEVDKKYTVKPPQFIGGRQAMFEFVGEHMTYPEPAWAYGLEGKVVVQINITSSGQVTAPTIVEGIGLGCDEAVLDLVAQMPKWKPALENGQPIASTIQIPVAFTIDY